MAITSISSQSTSTATVQNQEQQLLNQIKSLQSKNAKGNAAQIKVLQQQYNALVLQQTQATSSCHSRKLQKFRLQLLQVVHQRQVRVLI